MDTRTEVIVDILQNHRGRENAIKGRLLAERHSITEVELRSIRNAAQALGRPIGSHPEFGYFAIIDYEDFRLSVSQLASRVKGLLQAIKGLNNTFRGLRESTQTHQTILG